MKSKTIRVGTESAFIIEQAARELSAELKRDISVGEVFEELIENIEEVKKTIKKKPL
jgi:hypothetical protein